MTEGPLTPSPPRDQAAAVAADRLDRLFQALADPTRRAILARLSAGPATVGDLAESSGMALPSFMEHVRRLEDGGMITTRKEGRSRVCEVRPGALNPARTWIEEQRALWDARLDKLEDYLATLIKEQRDEQ